MRVGKIVGTMMTMTNTQMPTTMRTKVQMKTRSCKNLWYAHALFTHIVGLTFEFGRLTIAHLLQMRKSSFQPAVASRKILDPPKKPMLSLPGNLLNWLPTPLRSPERLTKKRHWLSGILPFCLRRLEKRRQLMMVTTIRLLRMMTLRIS